ncbi:MAG: methionine--tRNA ligase [Microthrixaceae bacterium]
MPRQLITSALPYINGVKHLGNLVGSMLPADAYARFLRLRGDEVLFVCATDEHGTPAELAARAEGIDVAEFCRINHDVQRDLCQRFDLSFDHFGRTSSTANHELTRHFARRLDEQGYLEERVISQLYSPTDGRFLPDRYVVGTCPYCGYPKARGDQCEHCTKQLDPTMLIEPASTISGATDLELRESRHLYLLQSKLAEQLREWITSKLDDWPTLATSIALKWLDDGLDDRGITRDLEWGVAVDRPGFEHKVFYVWFDAPIGYIAATREWAEAGSAADGSDRDWESWWRLDRGADDVVYTQFMGKDNVPFHTVGFPATLIGSGEPWRLVDRLKSFNWLNYYGGKFSTSDHRGVFMGDALELLPADYWRWYLLSNAPESDDTSFTWGLFAEAVNKDLVGTLGNFVNRTVTQVARHFDGRVPEGGTPADAEHALVQRLEALIAEYAERFEALQFRKAAQTLRALWSEGNVYLDATEPWRAVKVDEDAAAVVLRTALGIVRLAAHLASPFIPATAGVVAAMFAGAPLDGLSPVALAASVLELSPAPTPRARACCSPSSTTTPSRTGSSGSAAPRRPRARHSPSAGAAGWDCWPLRCRRARRTLAIGPARAHRRRQRGSTPGPHRVDRRNRGGPRRGGWDPPVADGYRR